MLKADELAKAPPPPPPPLPNSHNITVTTIKPKILYETLQGLHNNMMFTKSWYKFPFQSPCLA